MLGATAKTAPRHAKTPYKTTRDDCVNTVAVKQQLTINRAVGKIPIVKQVAEATQAAPTALRPIAETIIVMLRCVVPAAQIAAARPAKAAPARGTIAEIGISRPDCGFLGNSNIPIQANGSCIQSAIIISC